MNHTVTIRTQRNQVSSWVHHLNGFSDRFSVMNLDVIICEIITIDGIEVEPATKALGSVNSDGCRPILGTSLIGHMKRHPPRPFRVTGELFCDSVSRFFCQKCAQRSDFNPLYRFDRIEYKVARGGRLHCMRSQKHFTMIRKRAVMTLPEEEMDFFSSVRSVDYSIVGGVIRFAFHVQTVIYKAIIVLNKPVLLFLRYK